MSNMFYGEEMNMTAVHRAAQIKTFYTVLFAMAIVGLVLDTLPMLVYGVTLVYMGKACSSYKTAGFCLLASALLSLASSMFFEEEAVGSLILTVPAAVLSLVSVYVEIQGHAEMMVGIDDELSTKWEELWKLMMIAYIVLICSMVLIVIIPTVGAIVTIAGAIAVLVAEIRKVVYLYKMDNTIKQLV